MKLLQLINAKPAIDTLAAATLPVKTAWKIARAIPAIEAELKAFETARMGLAKQHGKPSEDGRQFVFESPEAITAMNVGLDAVVNEEIDIALPKLKLDDLGDIAMTAAQLASLEFMLEE